MEKLQIHNDRIILFTIESDDSTSGVTATIVMTSSYKTEALPTTHSESTAPPQTTPTIGRQSPITPSEVAGKKVHNYCDIHMS